MSDLGGLFNKADADAAREAGNSRLEAGEFGTVRKRVRNAHTRRAAMRTFLVAGAAFALGAAAVSGVKYLGGGEVAVPPSPSATASQSAPPTPTSAAFPAFAGTVTVDPHLPTASAITPEVWGSAEPGWSLISYEEQWADAGGADMHGPQVMYLVSPAGDRYELANLPGDTVSVLAWRAGAATAAVSVQPEGDPPFPGVLDLVTGKVTALDGYAPYMWSLAFLDAGGAPVWRGSDTTSAYVAIAPDGTQREYRIPAAQGAAQLAAAETVLEDCAVAAPFDDSSSLVQCRDSTGLPSVVRVWPAEERTEFVTLPGVGRMVFPTRAGDYVAGPIGPPAMTECLPWLGAFLGGAGGPIAGSDGAADAGAIFTVFGANGDQLVWAASNGCGSSGAPLVVTTTNLGSREFAVLMPEPAGRPANESPVSSVTGVAVGR